MDLNAVFENMLRDALYTQLEKISTLRLTFRRGSWDDSIPTDVFSAYVDAYDDTTLMVELDCTEEQFRNWRNRGGKLLDEEG